MRPCPNFLLLLLTEPVCIRSNLFRLKDGSCVTHRCSIFEPYYGAYSLLKKATGKVDKQRKKSVESKD